MENDQKKPCFPGNQRHDRFWTGLTLIIIGSFLLADKMGAEFPHWLFTWPMILILVGLISGFKHRFQNMSWLIMICIGGFFLIDETLTDWNLRHYFWPVAIIAFGVLFVLRPKKKWYHEREKWNDYNPVNNDSNPGATSYENISTADVIDSVSVFGGVKKVITSKDFKGGEIVCFMGGAEYNLSQADITGPISIEIVQVFGGTKLIVPPHWEIKTESVVIFAGIEDKRPVQPGIFDPNKVLILKGTSIFGGIDIRSY